MEWLARVADKTAALGSVVSAASCPARFPALASLGAAAGLGFLSEFEGLFIRTLLPLFAAIALVANAAGWFSHRQWLRGPPGHGGPRDGAVLRPLVDGPAAVCGPGPHGRRFAVGLAVARAQALRMR